MLPSTWSMGGRRTCRRTGTLACSSPLSYGIQTTQTYISQTVKPLPGHFQLETWANLDVGATHRFNAEDSDWGFTRFCELRKLFQHVHDDRGVPLVDNQEACLTAYVRVVKDPTGVLWHNFQKYVYPHYLSSYPYS